MDNNSSSEASQSVIPNSSQTGHSRQSAQLECLIRKVWADGWATGANAQKIREDVLRAAQSAFPDLSTAAISAAISQVRS